jgi:gliding motility-associated-like protein
MDSVLYESIHVKADFDFEYYDREEALDFVEFSGATEGEAPLLLKFKNASENGASYEWVFNDTVRRDALYSEITSEFSYEPEFTYYIPWEYYPYLVATSEAGCVDTLKVELPVKVLESELEVPNVFTPDGDNLNDYFTVTHRSMREFSLRIFNRSGDLVYKADISDLHQWDGWDGKVLNTGREASPGAYYYVIEARGWDSVYYRKGPYKGVVYLFREKE